MCTAISLRNESGFYFGRNMDLYYDLDFEIVKTPPKKTLEFTDGTVLNNHKGILGTAVMINGHPLYADGMNREGLCIAGLGFPKHAHYFDKASNEKKCIAPYELIPWVLSQCSTADQAKSLLSQTMLINRSFDSEHPLTPMHWMIADKEESIVAEPTEEGLRLYKNSANVLTNSPDYPFHAANLRQYANLSHSQPHINTEENAEYIPFSYGFGAIGLPGDWSSASRFVRAAFVTQNSPSHVGSECSASHFFRLLSSVSMPRGAVKATDTAYDTTVYSCCMDTSRGIYHFLPYDFVKLPLVSVSF